MLRTLASLFPLATLALPAQVVRYAPGEYRYTVVITRKQSDERGGAKQDYTVTARQTLALLLAPRGADSLRMRLTLVSYTLSSDLPVQLPPVERMNGTVVEGVMTVAGRVVHYSRHSPDSSSVEVDALAENMSRFLLWVTPGGTIGKPVVDTTSSRQSEGGNDITERTVTTTTIEGDTVFGGKKAWRIRRDTEVEVAGVQMQQGNAMQLAGGGTGTGYFYVSTTGVYLGSTARSTTTTTLKLPDNTSIASALDATSTVTLAP